MSDTTLLMTRRHFALTTASALGPLSLLAANDDAATMPWAGPAVVRKVYLGGRPSWPRPDADLSQDVAGIEARLGELERRYPGQIRFTGGEMLKSDAEVTAWLENGSDADVILAFPMVTITLPLLRKLAESGKPTVQFSVPYAGHDWTHCSAFTQLGKKADVIASSDYHELDPYIDAFNTIHHLRASRVLVVAPENRQPKGAPYANHFGTAFSYPSYLDVKAAFQAADVNAARKLADDFIRRAARMVEPSREEVVDSMRLHLGILDLMRREKANAITIDCLGGFGRGDLPAYPCISFSKLNDAGQYGVCECDLESTMTQLLVTSFSGKPGFVSDPVFDTSRNEVIHAHCVSATAMQGSGQPTSPYMIRTHLEDHKGVSVQVLLEGKGPVTVARFAGPAKFLLSTGEAAGNVDDERGCRTKMRTRVADSRKFLRNYGMVRISGVSPADTRDLLHRVVFYGDHTGMIERLGCLAGFQVIHEM